MIKECYHSAYNFFSEKIHNAHAIRLFRVCIYGILLYQTVVLCLPIAEYIWGSEAWIPPARYKSNWTYQFYMALHNPTYGRFYPFLVIIQICAILIGFTKRYTRLMALLVYVSTVLLFNRVFLMHTGGNYLLHILLFFLIFINENGKRDEVNTLLSNAFIWALKLQVIIVYIFSAVFKLKGNVWIEGETLHYLLNMKEFSLPFLIGNIEGIKGLLKVGTYASLAYQLLFPVLIWVKKIKPGLLLFGVLFHLLTIILQGIPIFGFVMIASYILFLSDDQVAKLRFLKR